MYLGLEVGAISSIAVLEIAETNTSITGIVWRFHELGVA
jgi:hypothetical protein